MANWSRLEVEAAVNDYLSMLHAERTGEAYNKTAHRRALSRKLDGRTDGSIERKHQNISAVLIEMGVPPIVGYKPLTNYQQLLFDVVAELFDLRPDLKEALMTEATMPAVVPSVEHILDAEVPPPDAKEYDYQRRSRETPRIRKAFDYLKLDASNKSRGTAGEEFVVRFEQARLSRLGKDRLAAAVEHVARTRGDGLGYDVLSFDVNGRERLIEVKTTAYAATVPFFVTRNEVEFSREAAAQFHLYRVFDFRARPRLYQVAGEIERSFALDPVQYVARHRGS